MYFHVTATSEDESIVLKEHGVSISEEMMHIANSMLDHLHIGTWHIDVKVDDPLSASQAPTPPDHEHCMNRGYCWSHKHPCAAGLPNMRDPAHNTHSD